MDMEATLAKHTRAKVEKLLKLNILIHFGLVGVAQTNYVKPR